MSNSSLINYTILSPNNSGKRTHTIDTFTPHCVVGQFNAEKIAKMFQSKLKKASCNYAIGKDGDVAMVVPEDSRSWCSSSAANDQRAITVEVASDTKSPYAFTETAYNKLIDLCVDVCKRNGKNKLVWIPDKTKALAYKPAANEMRLTVHRWFANKACPGDWLMGRMSDFAAKVNAKLQPAATQTQATTKPASAEYVVQVTADSLNIRKGPGTNYAVSGSIKDKGKYTIVEEQNGFGRLKSGAGWIALRYTKRV